MFLVFLIKPKGITDDTCKLPSLERHVLSFVSLIMKMCHSHAPLLNQTMKWASYFYIWLLSASQAQPLIIIPRWIWLIVTTHTQQAGSATTVWHQPGTIGEAHVHSITLRKGIQLVIPDTSDSTTWIHIT